MRKNHNEQGDQTISKYLKSMWFWAQRSTVLIWYLRSSWCWRHEIQEKVIPRGCRCGRGTVRGRSLLQWVFNRLPQIGIFLLGIVGGFDRDNVVRIHGSNRTDFSVINIGSKAWVMCATVIVVCVIGAVAAVCWTWGRVHIAVCRIFIRSSPSSSTGIVRRQAQPKDLWKREKRLTIHKKIVLAESWHGWHRRLGMCNNFHNVVSFHRPTVFKDSGSVFRIVNFLPVRQDQTFSRGDTPNNGHIVLFTTTISSGLPGC